MRKYRKNITTYGMVIPPGLDLDSMLGTNHTAKHNNDSRTRGRKKMLVQKKGRSTSRLNSVLAKRKEQWGNANKTEEITRADS